MTPPRLQTVLLWHSTPAPADAHHDWMLEDPAHLASPTSPGSPDATLWTLRLLPPTSDWLKLGTWDLTELALHRRAYLTYEGDLTGGRGSVRRIDQGFFTPHLWTPDSRLLSLHFTHFTGSIRLTRLAPKHWQAQVSTNPIS